MRTSAWSGQESPHVLPSCTGKTYFVKEMVADLHAGKKVAVIAKTRCAMQSASGDNTANHNAHKYVLHGSSLADCIGNKEITHVGVSLRGDLARLQFLQKQFISALGSREIWAHRQPVARHAGRR